MGATLCLSSGAPGVQQAFQGWGKSITPRKRTIQSWRGARHSFLDDIPLSPPSTRHGCHLLGILLAELTWADLGPERTRQLQSRSPDQNACSLVFGGTLDSWKPWELGTERRTKRRHSSPWQHREAYLPETIPGEL